MIAIFEEAQSRIAVVIASQSLKQHFSTFSRVHLEPSYRSSECVHMVNSNSPIVLLFYFILLCFVCFVFYFCGLFDFFARQ